MKAVRIADLKAHLSEYLREVKRGTALTVMERQTPVATLIPYAPDGEPLKSRPPARRSPSLREVALPPPLKINGDIVDLLLEERQGER